MRQPARPRRSPSGRALVSSACLALWLLASAGSAQEQPTDEPPPEAYMALVQEAVDESAAEHWVEARSLFREAQRVYPNARALRGIGMTSFELRDYTAAYRALAAALAETRRALDPEQRAQVAALLARVEGLIARYTLGHLGALRSVAVDGARQDLAGSDEVLLTAGEHRVHVVLADGQQLTGTWVVRGGEQGPLPLEPPATDMTPTRAAEAAQQLDTPAHPGAAVQTARSEPADTSTRRLAGALGLGLGGSAIIVGAVLVTVGGRDLAELELANPGTPWDDVRALRERAPRFVRTGGVLLVLGTGAASAGLVLTIQAAKGRRARADDQATLAPTSRPSVHARLLPGAAQLEVTW